MTLLACVSRYQRFLSNHVIKMARSSTNGVEAVAAASNVSWTHKEKMILLNTLIQEKNLGRMGDNGFKDRTWQTIVAAFHAAGYTTRTLEAVKSYNGKVSDVYSLFTNYTHGSTKLKQIWKAIAMLCGLSGFGWDATRSVVTASDKVWEDYIKVRQTSQDLI